MPYNRQTPQQLLQSIKADIDALLDGADARLRRSPEDVLAKMMVMAVYDVYGYLNWIFKQIHPKTADQDVLENNHAALRRIARKQAAVAIGQVTFTGAAGSVIPAGSTVQRGDRVEYTLDHDAFIATGQTTVTASVTAVIAGASGNGAAGIKMNLTTPIAGVQSSATVAVGGLYGGANIESDEELRKRVLQVWGQPPQGGADHDYERWALEVAGVTRAWVYRAQQGYGTVSIIVVMDNKPDTIIPTEEETALVKNYIEPRRTASAKGLYVIAPTPVSIDFNIKLSPNTPAVQAAVRAELADFFRRESEPGMMLYRSRINEAISAAAGEFDHELVAPAANIARGFGELSMLGDVTFGAIDE